MFRRSLSSSALSAPMSKSLSSSTLYAILSAVDMGYILGSESRADYAVHAGIYDCGGTAGLPEYAGSFKLTAHNLCLSVAAENIDYLVCDHILNCLTCRLEVLTRIEMIGMSVQVAADGCGHCKAQVGVDVYLAHSH